MCYVTLLSGDDVWRDVIGVTNTSSSSITSGKMSEHDATSIEATSSDRESRRKRSVLDVTPGRSISVSHQELHLNSLSEVRRETRRTSQYVQPSPVSSSVPQRRPSEWHRRPSIASSHRMTSTCEPVVSVKYENTYQLRPNDNQRFRSKIVELIISQILQSFLDGEQYDPRKCAQMSKHLSEVIKARIKELGLTRHKLVCSVVIGQNTGQTVRCASRCIWDRDSDGYASASFQNNGLFATAILFAVFFD